jgi:hypothetical protein
MSTRSIVMLLTVLLGCARAASTQVFKASLLRTSLETTPAGQWPGELGYERDQLYPLDISDLGCPFVDVEISGVKLPLMLDTGTARGLAITTAAPPIAHQAERRGEELNADGSHRGESLRIRFESLSVLGETFKNVTGTLADWKLFSSSPFNGTIGLDYFLQRRITLDYRSRQVAVTGLLLPERLDPDRYIVADLVQPPASQGHILYAHARVNGRESVVYLDTGYNVSFIDPAFSEGTVRIERPGKFPVFRRRVPLVLEGSEFLLDDLRESPIRRGDGFDLPVALTLGSDILSHFIVTIDIRSRKLILAVAG